MARTGDLEERVARLETALVELVTTMKTGMHTGIHPADEHPLDDVLEKLQAP